ncbi:hypothetical protein C0J52_12522 [Blattella germanica]|nr:hypothetical protein C0J52_12522 [Blattella germanica]
MDAEDISLYYVPNINTVSIRRWNMDVFNNARTMIHFGRIFGVGPYNVITEFPNIKFERSKFWTCYNYLTLFFLLSSFLIILTTQVRIKEGTVYHLTFTLGLCTLFIAVLFLQVCGFCIGNRLSKILNNLRDFDLLFSTPPRRTFYYALIFFQLYFILICNVVFCYISVIYISKHFYVSLVTAVHFWIVMFFSTGVIWTADSIFECFIVMVYQRFKKLNEIFVLVVQIQENLTDNENKHGNCESENNFRLLMNEVIKDTSTFSIIRILSCLQDRVCDIAEFINKTYTFQNLLSTIISFVHIIWSSYIFAMQTMIPHSEPTMPQLQKFAFTLPIWAFSFVAKLLTMLQICNTVRTQLM